jgi:hypothetical protein
MKIETNSQTIQAHSPMILMEAVVNFTNILWVHLRQYSCAKKDQTLNVST